MCNQIQLRRLYIKFHWTTAAVAGCSHHIQASFTLIKLSSSPLEDHAAHHDNKLQDMNPLLHSFKYAWYI